jgi:hypothetical protein
MAEVLKAPVPIPDAVETNIPACRFEGRTPDVGVTVAPDEEHPAIITLGKMISSKEFMTLFFRKRCVMMADIMIESIYTAFRN